MHTDDHSSDEIESNLGDNSRANIDSSSTTQTQAAIISELTLHRYNIALSPRLPVATQRIDQRFGLLLSAKLDSGVSNEVEISPLSGLDIDAKPLTGFSLETLEQVTNELEQQLPRLISKPLTELNLVANKISLPSAAFGLSLLALKFAPSFQYVHVDDRKISLFYYQPTMTDDELTAKVQALPKRTYAIKVKVAQASIEQEIQFIHQILSINPKLKLRLDANQGFSAEQAIEFLACLPKASIEYIEEPCKTLKESQLVYQALKVPFALDETLNDTNYQFTMLDGLAALVIKPMIIGSIDKLTQLIETATEYGVRCILSSSLEANLGINDLATLAAILTPDEIPGLDTLASFSEQLILENNQVNSKVSQLINRYNCTNKHDTQSD
ncbi:MULTISPECIES: o-succinylbenzoate synthase [Shewanella]|uniref:o-succinylbenzoate synthase n=1 Tax=Shewanella TaxID=22 RepID=UPI001BC5087D|nr:MULTISPECIES: o-succinylbenzoate synthase [Shewanella]GIU51057.1 o-succinylbenzoate synthase [Shewanella sp. KT0246]